MNLFKKLFLPVALVVSSAPLIVGCGQKKIDYVSQCRLDASLSVQGKNFLDNGIGKVTVKKYIDGDTTHFYQEEQDRRVVKVRYIGVDTPESTGQIEPWGKVASNFTKEKLSAAKTIVLTTDVQDIGKKAEPDSTGSRFKGLVWISEKENCPLNELNCLNLWLVQEGLSDGKGMAGSPISKYFIDAGMQAEELGLNKYSGNENDPYLWKGPAVETTLEALGKAYQKDYIDSEFIGKKVKVEGVVIKTSGTYDAFIVDKASDGTEYFLYVFAGYKTHVPMRTVGNRLSIVGTYTVYMGNPQLTGVSSTDGFFEPKEDDMRVISRDNPVEIYEKTAAQVQNRASVCSIVEIRNLTIYGGYTEIDQTTKKPSGALTFRTKDANDVQLSVRVPDDVWAVYNDTRVRDWEELDGKVLSLVGTIAFFAPDEDDPEEGYYQIKLCHKDDLTITESL